MRYLLSAMAALGLVLGSGPLAAAEHTSDTLDQVKQAIADGKAVLVDVREAAEWKAGHLQNAVLMPLSKLKREEKRPEFAQELAKDLPKDKVVYCHCRSGSRVLPASEILTRLGYEVRPLKPGYSELLKAGFRQASDTPTDPAK